jgi:hypothetical protein
LSITVSGEVEQHLSSEPLLIRRAHPVLAGIDRLLVTIVPPDAEPNKDGLVFGELEAAVKGRLKKAGFAVDFTVAGNLLEVPELRIDIDMLRLDEARQYVFRVQTSLARAVILSNQPSLHLKTDVWKTGSVMQAVALNTMAEEVTEAALNQVETFVGCCEATGPEASPPAARPPRGPVVAEPPEPAVWMVPVRRAYVASKNSKVFHRADCPWAKAIAPKNLVTYNIREKALEDGKRPCKRCNP